MMNNNLTRLPKKPTLKTYDELLLEAATVHTLIPRLRAEAKREYPTDHPSMPYIYGYLVELEEYINASTKKFEALQDEEADFAIKGNFSLVELGRRIARLQERKRAIEERGNVSSLVEYKAGKAAYKPVGPKGAA